MTSRRGFNWNKQETEILLGIWCKNEIQDSLKKSIQNKNVFELISEQMLKMGIVRSADQCQTRIKGLRRLYRRAIKVIENEVDRQRICPFFDQLHSVFRFELPSSSVSVCSSQENEDDWEETNQNIECNLDELTVHNQFVSAISTFIDYEEKYDERWYNYLNKTVELDTKQQQTEHEYNLSILKLITKLILTNRN
ncbi:unnamed protein product [Didymodactylos carnosus]|uniref:Myb/SANT-like DNA-binding domain-containing protein n=1 Tax=Didymodactylos carnosus TaxID=1234261 RepID=A0A8S2CNT4_9BILA|nr:unnamed protein product [Didymodactylos carnosus]CAF3541451.1 unnamed protein product [Didymodactylos carnosus]